MKECQDQNNQFLGGFANLLYLQVAALRGIEVDKIPTEREVLANAGYRNMAMILLVSKIHRLARAFLFRQLNDLSPDDIRITEVISEQKHLLRPLYLFGILFEGLASFQLARQTNGKTENKWIKRGDSILESMRSWSEHSSWNWENKRFLLEAEKLYCLGEFVHASSLYMSAIRSAREHKFAHEEALASELAGMFYYERGLHEKSMSLLMHSVWSYQKWGALAIAKRVEAFIESKYGPGLMQMSPNDDILGDLFALNEGSSKKRQERE